MTEPPHAPRQPVHPPRLADQRPSVDATDGPPVDEATRQAQDTVHSISRLEESN